MVDHQKNSKWMKLEKLKCTFQGLDIRLKSDKLCTSLKHSEMNQYQPFKIDHFDPSYHKTTGTETLTLSNHYFIHKTVTS
jgi:hypothetical protein